MSSKKRRRSLTNALYYIARAKSKKKLDLVTGGQEQLKPKDEKRDKNVL